MFSKDLNSFIYDDNKPRLNVLSVFDGISCGAQALEEAGVDVGFYYASEINEAAEKISKKNHPGIIRLGDVENWREWLIDWKDIDLIIAGSPCQGFSLQGKQLNFEDPRSRLLLHLVDIIKAVKFRNPDVQFFLENVKMNKASVEKISELLGVECVKVNSNLVSLQHRERLYWSSWKIEAPERIEVKDQISFGDFKPATVRKGNPRRVVFTEDFCCLTASYYKGIRADGRPALATKEGSFDLLKSEGAVIPLTPEHCEILQTLPRGYTSGVSKTRRYEMLGNGWTVKLIVEFLKQGGFGENTD